jgi:hypothetical protein
VFVVVKLAERPNGVRRVRHAGHHDEHEQDNNDVLAHDDDDLYQYVTLRPTANVVLDE